MEEHRMSRHFLTGALLALACVVPVQAHAHCDTLDGPVVQAARAALDTNDPTPVLIWVRASDEAAVKHAFEQTRAVRGLGPEAKQLADTYFFETVVRLHRAGEGFPYTGLKPAGGDLGPAIPAADKALEQGSADALRKLLTGTVERGVREHFEAANARKTYDKRNVEAGRQYVAAYVRFVHYVERLYGDAAGGASEHGEEHGTVPSHAH